MFATSFQKLSKNFQRLSKTFKNFQKLSKHIPIVLVKPIQKVMSSTGFSNAQQQQQPRSQTPSPQPQQGHVFTSAGGVQMKRMETFEAMFPVHPDHAGFVLGAGGKTMKGIGGKHRVHIRLHNGENGAWPKFKIVGNMAGVEQAFLALRGVANIANEKIPRMGVEATSKPSALKYTSSVPENLGGVKSRPGGLDLSGGGSSGAKTPEYSVSSPPYVPTIEVKKLKDVDGKEWLVEDVGSAVRKVFNEEGDVIGVYIVADNKVHMS